MVKKLDGREGWQSQETVRFYKTALMTHPPCGIVVFTDHVIRSNQGLSLDEKEGKEREPGFEVVVIARIFQPNEMKVTLDGMVSARGQSTSLF